MLNHRPLVTDRSRRLRHRRRDGRLLARPHGAVPGVDARHGRTGGRSRLVAGGGESHPERRRRRRPRQRGPTPRRHRGRHQPGARGGQGQRFRRRRSERERGRHPPRLRDDRGQGHRDQRQAVLHQGRPREQDHHHHASRHCPVRATRAPRQPPQLPRHGTTPHRRRRRRRRELLPRHLRQVHPPGVRRPHHAQGDGQPGGGQPVQLHARVRAPARPTRSTTAGATSSGSPSPPGAPRPRSRSSTHRSARAPSCPPGSSRARTASPSTSRSPSGRPTTSIPTSPRPSPRRRSRDPPPRTDSAGSTRPTAPTARAGADGPGSAGRRSVRPSAPGKYTLQVDPLLDPAADNIGSGHNNFSLRAKTAGSPLFIPCTSDTTVRDGLLPATPPYSAICPQVFGLEHLPIAARGNNNPLFFLSSIDSRHNGKTMQVTLYDSAEGASGISLVNPAGGTEQVRWEVLCADGSVPTAGACPQGDAPPSGNRSGGPTGIGRRERQRQQDVRRATPRTASTPTGCCVSRTSCPTTSPPPTAARPGGRSATSATSGGDRTTWSVKLLGDPVRLLPNNPTTSAPPVN